MNTAITRRKQVRGKTMNGKAYFTGLKCRTWQSVADLFDLDIYDLIGDTDEVEPRDELWNCIMLDELAIQHKEYIYEQTHFTEGISI